MPVAAILAMDRLWGAEFNLGQSRENSVICSIYQEDL